jgi:hypothetical protein
MSLTDFVSFPEVKQRLTQEFKMPSMECRGPLRVSSRTKSYGLVGTVFDYLLRFWLRRVNPTAEVKTWVAETAVELLHYGLDISPSVRHTAKRVFREAKETY